jgi:hypothetical protein
LIKQERQKDVCSHPADPRRVADLLAQMSLEENRPAATVRPRCRRRRCSAPGAPGKLLFLGGTAIIEDPRPRNASSDRRRAKPPAFR